MFSFLLILQAVGFWFGYGSGNYISRKLGQKEYEEAETMAATGVVMALAAGIAVVAAGLLFVRPLARVLGAGTSDGLMTATVSYLRITLVSAPFVLVSNVLYNQLRLQGSARDSMLGLLLGMGLNMVLDPFFILLLHMQVAGAALASMAGQVSAVWLLRHMTKKSENVSVHLKKCRLDLFHIREILAGGAPNFCMCASVLSRGRHGRMEKGFERSGRNRAWDMREVEMP